MPLILISCLSAHRPYAHTHTHTQNQNGENKTGDLVLEDMHIKKSLLDTLELPLALRHGILGRLEIRIPWKNLGKDPIVVVVDRVSIA